MEGAPPGLARGQRSLHPRVLARSRAPEERGIGATRVSAQWKHREAGSKSKHINCNESRMTSPCGHRAAGPLPVKTGHCIGTVLLDSPAAVRDLILACQFFLFNLICSKAVITMPLVLLHSATRCLFVLRFIAVI